MVFFIEKSPVSAKEYAVAEPYVNRAKGNWTGYTLRFGKEQQRRNKFFRPRGLTIRPTVGTHLLGVLIIFLRSDSQQLTGGRTMKFRPLYDRILVERVESEEKTAGGIILPDTAKEKPQQGKIIAVGHGRRLEDGKLIPLEVKAGDKILFGKYAGSEIKIEGNEYLIMKEDDVLGLVES
jgi:chaperonin GroES